jgi:hypothetical protein
MQTDTGRRRGFVAILLTVVATSALVTAIPAEPSQAALPLITMVPHNAAHAPLPTRFNGSYGATYSEIIHMVAQIRYGLTGFVTFFSYKDGGCLQSDLVASQSASISSYYLESGPLLPGLTSMSPLYDRSFRVMYSGDGLNAPAWGPCLNVHTLPIPLTMRLGVHDSNHLARATEGSPAPFRQGETFHLNIALSGPPGAPPVTRQLYTSHLIAGSTCNGATIATLMDSMYLQVPSVDALTANSPGDPLPVGSYSYNVLTQSLDFYESIGQYRCISINVRP